jgi:polysaccharide deacetylase family protein (PEP-CTERM system associated)
MPLSAPMSAREEEPNRPLGSGPKQPFDGRGTLLMSVDFEDWHQLVRRRIGLDGWEQPRPALRRQTDRLLTLLAALGIRATFFVLGMAARSHPDLVERIAAEGHDIGCHGDAHRLVHLLTPHEFAVDLRAARSTIERLTGVEPVGYRAPAFSITRETPWAYEVLLEEGFAYDASQHDSPWIRDRIVPAIAVPHPIELRNGTLWEFPVAVWRGDRVTLPVGGASYWSVVPTAVVLKGLAHAGSLAGLYLHPYELDPQPLRLGIPSGAPVRQRAHGLIRSAQRNLARARAAGVLQAIAERYRLIPYGEAHAKLSGSAAART